MTEQRECERVRKSCFTTLLAVSRMPRAAVYNKSRVTNTDDRIDWVDTRGSG